MNSSSLLVKGCLAGGNSAGGKAKRFRERFREALLLIGFERERGGRVGSGRLTRPKHE